MSDPGAPSGAVAEITTTAGTGPYQLNPNSPNALSAYFRFVDVFADGAIIPIEVDDTAKKEIIVSTFDAVANTLSRDPTAVLFSSAGLATLVDWPDTGQRTVRPLSGLPLCDTPPMDGQVLAWDSTTMKWCPETITIPNVPPGFAVCNTPPTTGQVLVWNGTEWCPADLCALVAACLMPTVDSVYLDGFTGAYYTNALTGVTDDPRLSFSMWIQAVQSGEAHWPFFVIDSTGDNSGGLNWKDGIGDLELFLSITSGSFTTFNGISVPPDGRFHNILFSLDMSNPNGAALWIDETDYSSLVSASGSGNIIAGATGVALGDFPTSPGSAGRPGTNGRCCVGDLWYAPGQYIDFSIQANRAKFHNTSTLSPIAVTALGAAGEIPTGTAPAVFMSGGKSTFGTNLGTGGPLTAAGVIEDCLEGLHTALTPATTRSGVTFDGAAGQLVFDRQVNNPPRLDTSVGLVSVWLRLSSLPTSLNIFYGIYGSGGPNVKIIDIGLDSNGRVVAVFTAFNKTTTATYTQTTGGLTADGTWHHLIVGWDTQAGTMQVVNDRTAATVTRSGSAGFDVGVTLSSPLRISWGALSHIAGVTANALTGDAAELLISLDQTLDLSVTSNLDKFELSGQTVSLGSNGSTPLGINPWMYCSQQPQGYQAITFYINRANDNFVTGDGTQAAPMCNILTNPVPAMSPYP